MTPTKQLNWSMIGVIVALAIQIAVLIFWGGGMTARIWPLPGWFMTAAAVLWFGVAANNALIWIKRRAAKR